ncbi:WhiB family transcriptional regulator [Janibacter sp. G1551]|uniref:WhiB family transcriptional regulator n=1 Tax=Janibacter sp. G1551 TaxID=3420440 RepID=UPI003CFFCA28
MSGPEQRVVRAMTARSRLDRALLELADKGGRPRCGDPLEHPLWTSEHADERARAVALCGGCPLTTLCRDLADETGATWGVWAGHDYSLKTKEKKR